MNSITPKVFRDIEDCNTAFQMISKLKLLYDINQNIQIEQWVTQLKNMRIKDSLEIHKTCINLKSIFTKMKNAYYNMQEKDKLQYMHDALPNSLKLIFIPNSNETVDNYLELKIKYISLPIVIDLNITKSILIIKIMKTS